MRLGDIRLRAKTRLCQDQTGCQDWQNASEVPFYKVIWSGNSYVTSSPTSIALPATGTVDLSITSSSTAIALKVAGLELGDSSSLSNNFSWSFGMPKLDGASVQVGSWLPSSGSYLSFNEKTITNSCLQVLSTGRIYTSPNDGRYTEYTASINGQY